MDQSGEVAEGNDLGIVRGMIMVQNIHLDTKLCTISLKLTWDFCCPPPASVTATSCGGEYSNWTVEGSCLSSIIVTVWIVQWMVSVPLLVLFWPMVRPE